MFLLFPFVILHTTLIIHSVIDTNILVHKLLKDDLKLFYMSDNGEYNEINEIVDSKIEYYFCFNNYNYLILHCPRTENIRYVLGDKEGIINIDNEIIKVRINDIQYIKNLIRKLRIPDRDHKEIRRSILKFRSFNPSFSELQNRNSVYDKLLYYKENTELYKSNIENHLEDMTNIENHLEDMTNIENHLENMTNIETHREEESICKEKSIFQGRNDIEKAFNKKRDIDVQNETERKDLILTSLFRSASFYFIISGIFLAFSRLYY